MDLKVSGEKHLWSHRPAVFIFNHQSKADVIIIAKLLRRDIAGVGKQEIKKETPILGKVLELGGVVFIDRANAKSAIDSMTPLVEAMKNDGKSVVLAPEGTRTVSPRLAPFKKGAFHLAMQAGVPIVPIVIRNAGDVAPKGDFVFRAATVEVQVLPPVDTGEWRVETIEEHVREVRNMFARTLGQPEETAPGAAPRAKPAGPKAKAKSTSGAKAKAKAKVKTATGAKTRAKAQTTKAPAKKSAAKRPARGQKIAKTKTRATPPKKPATRARPKTSSRRTGA
jgi:putative phosphoserine phosphatase/1-acylglycerol-3-phosphate O-acyltransferase